MAHKFGIKLKKIYKNSVQKRRRRRRRISKKTLSEQDNQQLNPKINFLLTCS